MLPIRITDLNHGRHLGNDSVLTLMHEARIQFFCSFGYGVNDAEGTGFLMGDCAIMYRAEGFYGQVLRCEVGAGDYSRASFDIFYRFTIVGEEKLLAEAKTGMVCYNHGTRKVQPVPDALRARLGDVCGNRSEQSPAAKAQQNEADPTTVNFPR